MKRGKAVAPRQVWSLDFFIWEIRSISVAPSQGRPDDSDDILHGESLRVCVLQGKHPRWFPWTPLGKKICTAYIFLSFIVSNYHIFSNAIHFFNDLIINTTHWKFEKYEKANIKRLKLSLLPLVFLFFDLILFFFLHVHLYYLCLLYTSDAADDWLVV